MQATDDSIIRRMRIACWITEATDTHSEYVMFLLFHGSSGYANVPHCYVVVCVCVCIYIYIYIYI